MPTIENEKLIDCNYTTEGKYMRLLEIPVYAYDNPNNHVYTNYCIEIVDVLKMSFIDKQSAKNVFFNLTFTRFEVIGK
jgi:hypothetical protein